MPSAEAVQVFDWFLTELADRKKQVYAVSGNHDSAERIAFGAQLMCGRGAFCLPCLPRRHCQITMTDSYGELCLYLLPFCRRQWCVVPCRRCQRQEETPMPESYHEAVKLAVARMNVRHHKSAIF